MELKGITWDHARGYNPLLPVSTAFCKAHPGVEISWKKRSLQDFEDFPVSKLAELYDMIMIDHPYMTAGSRAGFLLDLSSLIEPSYFDMLTRDAVGPSLESYCVGGHYYGLPVDAAAQVAAENAPAMQLLGVETPKTVEDAIRLSDRIGKERFALPLVPTHLFSTFMSLTAQCSQGAYFDLATGIRSQAAQEAAELLYRLIAVSNPVSFQRDPITLCRRLYADRWRGHRPDKAPDSGAAPHRSGVCQVSGLAGGAARYVYPGRRSARFPCRVAG